MISYYHTPPSEGANDNSLPDTQFAYDQLMRESATTVRRAQTMYREQFRSDPDGTVREIIEQLIQCPFMSDEFPILWCIVIDLLSLPQRKKVCAQARLRATDKLVRHNCEQLFQWCIARANQKVVQLWNK